MKNKVIFIDDEVDSRDIFEDVLQDVYGEEYEVLALEPEKEIGDMLKRIFGIQNVVSIIIDQKLKVYGHANYLGSQLVDAIRMVESKIPVYILTSETSLLNPILGSVEFIIDKKMIENEQFQSEFSQRMRRHLNTFSDIQSERSKRLNELLIKSVDDNLSELERKEFEELNVIRMKPILLEEQLQSETLRDELNKQEKLLSEIEAQLKELGE